MKKLLLASAAFITLAGSALAADLATKKTPPAPTYAPPVWTGFYGGLNFGGGWGSTNGASQAWYPDAIYGGYTQWRGKGNGFAGILGGGQVGYNYQFGNTASGIGMVFGAEADFQGTNIVGGAAPLYSPLLNLGPNGGVNNNAWGYANGQKALPWFGTVRGRVGILATPALLLYGTGGFAYGYTTQNTGWWQNSAVQTGWTAGGGLEWMFMRNWSLKLEYLYSQISGGNNNTWLNAGRGVNNINSFTRWNTVRAGVNYHFNWVTLPIVAKY